MTEKTKTEKLFAALDKIDDLLAEASTYVGIGARISIFTEQERAWFEAIRSQTEAWNDSVLDRVQKGEP